MSNRLLTITLGDPWSINCEATHHLLSQNHSHNPQIAVLVVGSWTLWQTQNAGSSWTNRENWTITSGAQPLAATLPPGKNYFWDMDEIPAIRQLLAERGPEPALWSAMDRGQLGWASLRSLAHLPHCSKLAVLTCPIDKHAMALTSWGFPGQTEYFSHLWQDESIMILAGERLKVGLATNHLPLAQVSTRLSVDLITKKILLLGQTLDHLPLFQKTPKRRLAIAGLNPHASDGGLFGDEEVRIIIPAIAKARSMAPRHWEISEPMPADTIFHRALTGDFDAVLAMYHDQGLGPIKTVSFYDAINITGGLRHLRCSPDHGPARDLAGTGKARFDSFNLAWQTCHDYLA